jgi:hypothetical protein
MNINSCEAASPRQRCRRSIRQLVMSGCAKHLTVSSAPSRTERMPALICATNAPQVVKAAARFARPRT